MAKQHKLETPSASPTPSQPPAKSEPSDQKRTQERWDLSAHPITFRLKDAANPGTLRDVSDTGCLVVHKIAPPTVGTPVVIELPPSFGPLGRVRVTGSVRWVGKHRDEHAFGVEFAKGQEDTVRKLLFRSLVDD